MVHQVSLLLLATLVPHWVEGFYRSSFKGCTFRHPVSITQLQDQDQQIVVPIALLGLEDLQLPARPVLQTELELIFIRHPELSSKISLDHHFQYVDYGDYSTSAAIAATTLAHSAIPSDRDVEQQLKIFRQVILGVEKYRISNPGNIAKKYVQLLRTCLRAENAWAAAASSLSYAGLVFRDHVTDITLEPKEAIRTGSILPVIDLNSLWHQSAVRLLDLEFSKAASVVEDNTDKAARTGTFDQKYFSQIELTPEAQADVKDMLLLIMRIIVRVVLSREGVSTCCLKVTKVPGFDLEPSRSSVELVLGLDFCDMSTSIMSDLALSPAMITISDKSRQNLYVVTNR